MATLTYVYADSTAVLGPLSPERTPGAYDLCVDHAHRLSVPQGWEVIRLQVDADPAPSRDDLSALADAVREAANASEAPEVHAPRPHAQADVVEVARRGHLTVLADADRTRR